MIEACHFSSDVAKEKSEGSDDNNIMSGFFSGTIGRHNVVLTTGQKFDNLPPDNKIEMLEVSC